MVGAGPVLGETGNNDSLGVEGRVKLKVREATKARLSSPAGEDRAILGVEDVRVSGGDDGLGVAVGGDRLGEC